MDDSRELTFGEKAVGITFNVGGREDVNEFKEAAAKFIDLANAFRERAESGEVKRMYDIAITEAQAAQMWAVKAVTWK